MTPSADSLSLWLDSLDSLSLECDGLTRVISALLLRESIDHQVHIGSLEVAAVGTIPHHWWINLPEGFICDYRARMWLGDGPAVPHGFVLPGSGVQYRTERKTQDPSSIALPLGLLSVMAGINLAAYPRLG